jgi:hypothetical protein
MIPAQCDISLYRGDDFSLLVRLRSSIWDNYQQKFVPGPYVNLTGWTGKAQVRPSEDSPTVITEFQVIVLDQTQLVGGVQLMLADEQSSLITVGGTWDMQLTDTTDWVATYLKGNIILIKDVSK